MFALAEEDIAVCESEQQQSREQRIREEPIDVDRESGLFGMLTRPTGQCRNTAFVIINSGLLHRVGPFRLYVDIARRLAESGFASIRLDQSGKGDSDARPGIRSAQAAITDVTAAARNLEQKTGASRIVVGGLCSGADDALQIAAEVPGIAGLFMFDGYAPRTLRFYLRFYGSSLLSARSMLTGIRSVLGTTGKTDRSSGNLRNWSSRTEMLDLYRTLIDREVSILSINTSGSRRYYNYVSQLASTIGSLQASSLVTERYYPEASHLFHFKEHRNKAVSNIVDWANQSFARDHAT